MRTVLLIKSVMEGSGYSRVQIWRKSHDPDDPFPASVALGENKIGWWADEFEAWQESRPRRGTKKIETVNADRAAATSP